MTHLLRLGTVVAGRYRVRNFIDEGGMQEVYRAIDTSLGREVALKIPKSESGKKRFQRSAAVSARVTHPNVAKTFDYVEEAGRQILIEELVPGPDLRHQLETVFFYLDPHLAAHVFHHLAKGLAAVHRENIIHRDLKPSNIVLSSDHDLATVKITDFGIAKMAEAEIAENINDMTFASRTVVGAIPYMAPEVIANRDNVSTSADVWSLGAILYHLLTGERPFGDGLQAVHRIMIGHTPNQPKILATVSSQFKQLAEELWGLVIQCLHSNPANRPTAAALVQQCNRLCYSRASRTVGTIDNYRPKSGSWGFIRSPRDNGGTFFHADSFWGTSTPEVGQSVCYAQFPGVPRNRAHPVLLIR